ncbi:pyruvate dehydrogenase (acetyl-transferring) E1 component subunit alpha [Streptomyces pluripotens]|uniref:Pyruvate dehydrogenase E1 component subunit alpha n=1 Tax=Streptomyces pluripotens TaxID=1355015 RepID=A0A221NTQ0_9ACTN|nr:MULTISPECIES: pyruvate dehydrogenase (acetyl-transferring) E1 component subunit alpha [Streptomyces]ARP68657.1 pyruvate dehydrogenase (acetyl-transferring) E1 component subunit alpha [Streptomyces pluripotens]ASN22915.1 pyruvate dehydrogenase (acetyl-transferring) E1 component subunit alpha [Streptomyces pluripotens]MCH0559250.1 pyruvate dehydrogenase (acetyl-transferring) E1 component subunit alpha [Streptomyces sp. MUM 16J]
MSTTRRKPARTDQGTHRDTDAGHHRELLASMLLIRRFEERCVELYSAAKIRGFVHLYIGEEAVAVGVLRALTASDAVVSTYREHGHALARGVPADSVMAEMYGKITGCSRGRGGSMHLFDEGRRFYGGNAIVGGGLPLAAGLALAERMRGGPGVVCCFFGDGAFAEGEFHETANLAALWDLPLLLACENNLYAMGTPLHEEHAQTDLAMRAASYGMASWAVDGMDVLAVEEAARRAVDGIRAGHGPHFLELRTYRFRAHSMYDPDRYRDKAEIERWRQRDPLLVLGTRMRAAGELDDMSYTSLDQEAADVVDRAVSAAESAPLEPAADLLRYVSTDPGDLPESLR